APGDDLPAARALAAAARHGPGREGDADPGDAGAQRRGPAALRRDAGPQLRRARAYCFFQPPPKRREKRPPLRLGRKLGCPWSGGGSFAASSALRVRVTPRCAVRATSGASAKRTTPSASLKTTPSKMRSR